MSSERTGGGHAPTAGPRPERVPGRQRQPELPEDLKLISLKYGNECRVCGTDVPTGTRAYWSPSTRSAVWCKGCVLGLRTPRVVDGSTDTPQDRWARLCRYLSKCVLAEMADTLASYGDPESWFLHDAEAEALVTGDRDTTPVPAPLGRRLDESERQSTFIYGWPTLVAMNRQRKPMIAPLFAVTVRVERQGDEWIGHAESEPEFNLSVVAGELFDLSIKDEVEAVVGEGLPFGDGAALARVARTIARVLGVKVAADLDPRSLDGRCEGTPGIRNAAVWVATGDGRNVYGSLLDELEKLAHRKDWKNTAAVCLVPDGRTSGRAVPPNQNERIAAPLSCNDSQELTLERLRHEPLTVVTGPPGTGKTQLVVNAVANAWLDGETVLVASTNNGAVDVAVERANDIRPGMLLRTGRRQERGALAGRAGEAVAAAAEDKAPADGLDGVAREARARAALAKAAERRARLYADLSEAAALNGKLLENVEELEKHARVIWKRIRAPYLDIDSERIERRAKRIQRAWFFRGWRKRRLLRSVRCGHRGVPLDTLARWAAVDRGRTTLLDELSSMEKRIGDADTNIRRIGEVDEPLLLLANSMIGDFGWDIKLKYHMNQYTIRSFLCIVAM